MASPRPRICRVSGIPRSWMEDTVRKGLEHHDIDVQPGSLRLMPSCLDPGMSTATIAVSASSNNTLQRILKNPLESEVLPYQGASLVVDQHFSGLTTLACPLAESQIQARIIAVHGLSGNAFGSWSTHLPRGGQHVCWLRDFLADDCPNLHVMTYGYESRLDKTTTVSSLVDYRRAFLRDMMSFMATTRALLAAKLQAETAEYGRILTQLAGIFFFGVPQHGLRTDELRHMTHERSEESKTKILADLREDSDSLRQSAEFLASLSLDVQMVSVYEDKPTPSPARKDDGEWASTGEAVVMVSERSAVLNLPNEVVIPAAGDHKTMVKFTHRDNHYIAIRNQIEKILAQTITSSVARGQTHAASPNQRLFNSMSQDRVSRSSSSEGDVFSVAFGVSGASVFARGFLAGFHGVVAAYIETPGTHPAFVDFRFRCWMFVTWLEAMKSSWKGACHSGFAQSCLGSPILQNLIGPLKDLVQEVAKMLNDAIHLKERYGSFEVPDLADAGDRELRSLTTHFQVCIKQLHSFATPQQRRHFTEESTAVTLVASQDNEALQQLNDVATAGLPSSLAESIRLMRELHEIRNSPIDTSLWKPLDSIIGGHGSAAARRSGGTSLRLATYFENSGVSGSTRTSLSSGAFHAHAAQRVLIEWTTLSTKWKREHVQLCRSRMTKLVQELNISSKPAALGVLRAIALVEDFRDERNRRFGIVFSITPEISPVRQPVTLQEILPADSENLAPYGEPLLEDKFALAHTLANALHELHRLGWLHKELRSANVVFFFGTQSSSSSSSSAAAAMATRTLPDLTKPYIVGFGFARPDEEGAVSLPAAAPMSCSAADLYRHPSLRLPPKSILGRDEREEEEREGEGEREVTPPRFQRQFDIYSLGLILLEIGLWEQIASFGRPSDKGDPVKYTKCLTKLCSDHVGHRMGATYRDAVLRCICGGDSCAADGSEVEVEAEVDDAGEEMMAFYFSVVKELEKCQCGRRN